MWPLVEGTSEGRSLTIFSSLCVTAFQINIIKLLKYRITLSYLLKHLLNSFLMPWLQVLVFGEACDDVDEAATRNWFSKFASVWRTEDFL